MTFTVHQVSSGLLVTFAVYLVPWESWVTITVRVVSLRHQRP